MIQQFYFWVFIQRKQNTNPPNICTSMFTAALPQPRYGNNLSINGCMDKDVVYIYNGILFSHRKKEILLFGTTWMELEGIMLNEIRERQILNDLTQMWNLKQTNKNQAHKYKEQICGYQRRGQGVGKMGDGGQKVQSFIYK